MKKILLVNDCKLESIIMKDKLTSLGYKVEIANEYGVFSKINKFNPQVVIVNFIMKEITGDRLIEKIKIKRPDIICILSSCDKMGLDNFKNKSIDEVINTPVDERELSSLMDKALLKSQINAYEFRDSDIKEESGSEIQKKNTIPVLEKTMSFCPYCRGKLNNNINNSFMFCPYCGKKL